MCPLTPRCVDASTRSWFSSFNWMIQHFERHRAIIASSITVRFRSSSGTGPRKFLFARDNGGSHLFLREEWQPEQSESVGGPPSDANEMPSGSTRRSLRGPSSYGIGGAAQAGWSHLYLSSTNSSLGFRSGLLRIMLSNSWRANEQ